MATAVRNFVLNRRGPATSAITGQTLESGELTFEQVIAEGIWKYNGTQQIGIATAQESGLTADRFPVRVVIVSGANYAQSANIDAVMRYWKIEDSTGNCIRFERLVNVSKQAVDNYYKAVTDLDKDLWDNYLTYPNVTAEGADTSDLSALRHTAWVNASVQNTTPEINALISTTVAAIIVQSKAVNRYPRIQIAENMFLVGKPHGTKASAVGNMTSDMVGALEVVAMLNINNAMLAAQYPNVDPGSRALAAYCIANMFRYGLMECYENKEYYTLVCQITNEQSRTIAIRAIDSPANAPPLVGYAVNQEIVCTAVKVSSKMVQISMGAIVCAGVNHYSFNHTTGGVVVTGPLLTLLATAGSISGNMTNDEQEEVTRVFYQALHPVNKRAVANIFFKHAKVYTHGKLAGSRVYNKFEVDTFISIRNKPYPAGSHKAYICALVLKRLLLAHLAAFLPWANDISTCTTHCAQVLSQGARAHMGSHYYTGESPIQQSSELDKYLPELAAYMQSHAKMDSITFSPHLSQEVAARANTNWVNFVKSIKGQEITGTSVDAVRSWLTAAGVANVTFDPNDSTTYGNALDQETVAVHAIDAVI